MIRFAVVLLLVALTGCSSRSDWTVTVYYTAVAAFHDGASERVVGCPQLECDGGSDDLGTYPATFVQAVRDEGTGRVDTGRYGGIRRLQASPYTLLGAFNDDPKRSTATSTRHVSLAHRNYGEFRVPSLRNVARTAPYMHDGSLATLRDVIRHYSDLDENRLHADGESILRPLRLSDAEIDDLVAFLESLTSTDPP